MLRILIEADDDVLPEELSTVHRVLDRTLASVRERGVFDGSYETTAINAKGVQRTIARLRGLHPSRITRTAHTGGTV